VPDITVLYYNPARNVITSTFAPGCREVTKAEVPDLIRAGAEVDQSARETNVLIKMAERQ
jgi:hypothetical protein